LSKGSLQASANIHAEMTDDEIEKSVRIFSFDLEVCASRLKRGDDWQRVIQAHLFFDHVLSRTITEALTAPGHVNLDRTAFSAKLDLAASLSLVDNHTKSFLVRMNRLRNSIAHDLGFVVSRVDVSELYHLTPKPARDLIDEERGKKKLTLLGSTFLVNLVFLDIFRQNLAARRLVEARQRKRLAAAMKNARQVLDKINNYRGDAAADGTGIK